MIYVSWILVSLSHAMTSDYPGRPSVSWQAPSRSQIFCKGRSTLILKFNRSSQLNALEGKWQSYPRKILCLKLYPPSCIQIYNRFGQASTADSKDCIHLPPRHDSIINFQIPRLAKSKPLCGLSYNLFTQLYPPGLLINTTFPIRPNTTEVREVGTWL